MLYAVLCYHDEATTSSWTKAQDDLVMNGLAVVRGELEAEGKLGPSIRLLPTSAATTLHKSKDLVIDGPYAETKEQLLGFYIIDCVNLDEAIDVARRLAVPNPGGAYEIRPIGVFIQGLDIT